MADIYIDCSDIMERGKGRRVFVVGVGMTKVDIHTMHTLFDCVSHTPTLHKFEKPGRREDFDYPQMAKESGAPQQT